MFNFITYPRIFALIIIVIALWILLILYRVFREPAIKKVDFYQAHWKIVLFWLVIAALAIGIMYLTRYYDFAELSQFLPKKK